MAQITDQELRADAQIDGTEEYLVEVSGITYKANGSGIVKAVTDSLNNYITSNDEAISDLQNDKLNKSGGTLTGALILSGNATSNLQAIPKQQLDNAISGLAPESGAEFDVNTKGTTQATSIEDTTLATTKYVANKIENFRKQTTINSTPVILTEEDSGI